MARQNPFFKSILIVIVIGVAGCNRNPEIIRFGVCADVHRDIMFDAEERLRYFVDEMNHEKVDFIIQLGDFCFPKEENRSFVETWNSYNGPTYHVLGNHDMDISSKQKIMDFLDMENNYYSFDIKGIHFTVLDPNSFMDSNAYVPYENGNYYAHGSTRGNFPPEQLEWLRKDLENTSNPVILFSHQPLSSADSTKNVYEVRTILEKANEEAGFKKVIACINGHTHTDDCKEINGIQYIQINSMSYKWLGEKYACPERYNPELNAKYPSLKYTAPYRDPLYALVEIHPGSSISIKGRKSDWVPPSPWELGYRSRVEDEDSVPRISDRQLMVFAD
jgi:predicted phosphodiesterase